MITRRNFITGIASISALGTTGLLGSACSLTPMSSYSYVSQISNPSNISAVFYWTDVMLQTVRDQSINPPKATRVFAMGHLAGFTAINGSVQRYEPYKDLALTAPADIDQEISYGVAFSYAIAEAFQSSFHLNRQSFLKKYPNSDKKSRSIEWGKKVGNAVAKMRVQDGAEPSKSEYYLGRYQRRDDLLKWAPIGPFYGAPEGPAFNSFNRGLLPGWGAQKPWVMANTQTYRAPEFPDPRSEEFARQFVKIKSLGGKNYSTRTADQTQIAFFWEDGPRGITPPGHWQLIAMDVLQHLNMDLLDEARIFTLMSIAQADAGISTWDSKFYHDILRPETAIRVRADKFNNADKRVASDTRWMSLIPTPPFPAYTSGHSTFSAASAKILALALGKDDIKFSSGSPDLINWPTQLKDVRRTWSSFSAAAKEASASREYGGIHWEADAKEGMKTGYDIGQIVFEKTLRKKV